MVDLIANSAQLQSDVQDHPVKALRGLAKTVTQELPPPAFVADAWLYRGVVLVLGIVAVSAIVGTLMLAGLGSGPTPEAVIALGAAAIGALAGLLAPSPAR
jgi:hypothetical protein